MESWRDIASEQVDDDFETLMDVCMPWAERALSRYRDLAPFGGSIGIDDSKHFDATGEGEDSLEMLEALQERARRQRYILRATAFVADARLPEEGGKDALIVHLEHAEGVAIKVAMPYRRNRLLRRVRFEENQVGITDPIIWT